MQCVTVLLCKVLPSEKAERGSRAEKSTFCPSVGGFIGQHYGMSMDTPRFLKVYLAFSGVHILPSGSFFFPPETSTCLVTSCCICSFTSVTVVFVITAVTIDSFGAE